MSEQTILTFAREAFVTLPEQGAWDWPGDVELSQPVWLVRAQAEQDERYRQLIPYLLIHDATGNIWSYARRGGDPRLQDRFSCGVGGHVERQDRAASLASTLGNALRREVREELGPLVADALTGQSPKAWIYESLSAIGRVHAGVLYTFLWTHPALPQPLEPALASLGFLDAETILADSRFERWSRLAVRWWSASDGRH